MVCVYCISIICIYYVLVYFYFIWYLNNCVRDPTLVPTEEEPQESQPENMEDEIIILQEDDNEADEVEISFHDYYNDLAEEEEEE